LLLDQWKLLRIFFVGNEPQSPRFSHFLLKVYYFHFLTFPPKNAPYVFGTIWAGSPFRARNYKISLLIVPSFFPIVQKAPDGSSQALLKNVDLRRQTELTSVLSVNQYVFMRFLTGEFQSKFISFETAIPLSRWLFFRYGFGKLSALFQFGGEISLGLSMPDGRWRENV
jgi:hypothetical protein